MTDHVTGDYQIEGPEHESLRERVIGESIERVEKRSLVIRLRRAGLTYDQISEAIAKDSETDYEVSPQRVQTIVSDYLAKMAHENQEALPELRALENMRLDDLQAALEEKVRHGSVPAVRAILGVMERRARMNGLDKPTRHEVAGVVAHLHEVADPAEVAKVEAEFAAKFGQGGSAEVIEAEVVED